MGHGCIEGFIAIVTQVVVVDVVVVRYAVVIVVDVVVVINVAVVRVDVVVVVSEDS